MVPPEATPVVVSNVEKGTSAEVAKVRQYDLIMKVNDQPVEGLDGFKTMMEEAVAAHENGSTPVLRLTLQRLGKTRIADLKLEWPQESCFSRHWAKSCSEHCLHRRGRPRGCSLDKCRG